MAGPLVAAVPAILNGLRVAASIMSLTASIKSLRQTSAHNDQQSMPQGQPSISEAFKSLGTIQKKLALVQDLSTQAVNAAADRITAEQRLQQTMNRQPSGMSPAKLKQMSGFADDQEKRSSISAVTGITGMTELGKSVMNPEHVMKLSSSMYDLAAGTYGARVSQEQMVQTASLLGNAMEGQLSGLEGLGFEITQQQELMMRYGSEAQRTKTLIEILDTKVQGMAQSMANTPTGKIEQLNNAWTGVMETVGTLLMPAVMQFVDFIMEKMPAIEAFMVGAFTAINGAIWFVIDVISVLFNFIQENWSWIQPILVAIITVYIAGIIMGLIAMAAAWLIMASPILIIIGIVFGLIKVMQFFGFSAQEVVATIMNRFGLFFAQLWNGIAFLWNGFARVAEFLGNVFIDPVFAIKKLFYDMVLDVLERLQVFAKMVEDLVVKTVGILKKIGIDIDIGDSAHFISGKLTDAINWFKSKEPTSDKDVYSLPKMDYRDVFGTGEEWAGYSDGLFDKAGTAFDNFKGGGFSIPLGEDLPSWPEVPTPQVPTPHVPQTPQVSQVPPLPGVTPTPSGREPNIAQVGKVGEVGKINKEVDISQEDLKLMRDLAEIKAIQNFVTLTPTVQVTTGDIVEKADLDDMIRRFQQSMEQEIAYAARGVYG